MVKTSPVRTRVYTLVLLGAILLVGMNSLVLAQANDTPWRTPEGRACIDAWMQDAISRLNSSDLGSSFNDRKPWRFNPYGVLLGRLSYHNRAPDLFSRYENVQHWVWAHFNRDAASNSWTSSYSFLNRADIPSCKSDVSTCLARQDRQTQPIVPGQSVFLRSFNYPDRYVRHSDFLGELTVISSQADREDAAFKIVPGLADSRYVSFESVNFPGYYLRHQDYRIKLHERDNDATFREDATFKRIPGLADDKLVSFESFNFPGHFIRHRDYHLYIEKDNTDVFREDATFIEELR